MLTEERNLQMSEVVVEQQLCIGNALSGADKYKCLIL